LYWRVLIYITTSLIPKPTQTSKKKIKKNGRSMYITWVILTPSRVKSRWERKPIPLRTNSRWRWWETFSEHLSPAYATCATYLTILASQIRTWVG